MGAAGWRARDKEGSQVKTTTKKEANSRQLWKWMTLFARVPQNVGRSILLNTGKTRKLTMFMDFLLPRMIKLL